METSSGFKANIFFSYKISNLK